MPGDAKTHSRKKKENDQVERFTESRLVLQRAMEKDYLTTRESKRSVEDDHASERRGQKKDANAERLAALLEAARQQEEAVAVGTGDTASANEAPTIDREHARPASLLTEDIRAARVRATHPDTAPAPAGDAMPPPLVNRNEGVPTDSAGRMVVRLLIVAFIAGMAGYVFFYPETPEETVSSSEQSLSAPAAVSATQPSSDAPASDGQASDAPAAQAPASAAPVGGLAAAPSGDGAQASSAAPPEAAVPAETLSAPAGPADAADSAAKPITAGDRPVESGSPAAATTAAAPASGASDTATESAVRQVVVLPPPPPPPPSPLEQPSGDAAPTSAAVPEPSGTKLSIGEETLRALSLIEEIPPPSDGAATDTAPAEALSGSVEDAPADVKVSADGPPPPGDAATGEAARTEPVSVDRRPFFRRLGPTPGPNPFRPDEANPPPAPESSQFFTFPLLEIE